MVQSGVSSGRVPKTSQRAKLKASECVPRPCYHADMITKDENLWSECRCGAQWDGLWKEHCVECHNTFESSLLGLDHRVGQYVPNTRRCLSIDERTDRGWVLIGEGLNQFWSRGGQRVFNGGNDQIKEISGSHFKQNHGFV